MLGLVDEDDPQEEVSGPQEEVADAASPGPVPAEPERTRKARVRHVLKEIVTGLQGVWGAPGTCPPPALPGTPEPPALSGSEEEPGRPQVGKEDLFEELFGLGAEEASGGNGATGAAVAPAQTLAVQEDWTKPMELVQKNGERVVQTMEATIRWCDFVDKEGEIFRTDQDALKIADSHKRKGGNLRGANMNERAANIGVTPQKLEEETGVYASGNIQVPGLSLCQATLPPFESSDESERCSRYGATRLTGFFPERGGFGYVCSR
jgi:hypothetical protein